MRQPSLCTTMTVNPSETRKREHLALSLVETCVRNTGLEDLHAGRWPRSATGDYSDVRVMTPEITSIRATTCLRQ